jgi:hypothetical protein
MFCRLQLVFDHFYEHKQVFINEDNLVFGMIDDVYEMMYRQPEVDGMKNSSITWNTKVKLEMTMVIECNACHPVTALDTQRFQRVRELTHPFIIIR